MAVNVAALVVVIVFYVIIVIVGIVAAWKFKVKDNASSSEHSMVAGRNLGLGLGIVTCAATYVDGGFINGTAEGIVTPGFGLAWTIAPLGICIGVTIGGFVFGTRMRARNYVTMLDPFTEKYGNVMTGLLFLGALMADLLWGAAILGSLGNSLSVIVDIGMVPAVVVSAIVALLYTAFGQLISVAYTDIVQLVFMTVGMILCVPFAMTNENVSDISTTRTEWLGSIPAKLAASWVDFLIVQIFGSIPWQTFFQRVLAVRVVWHASFMSVISGLSALAFAVPPLLIGAVAVSTNWNNTDLGYSPIEKGEYGAALPLVLQYLTPAAVSIIGLSAVVGAVMSSLDSLILGSSSMFTNNVYRMTFRKKASDSELMIIQRLAMLAVAAAATCLAIFVNSIYSLFYLAADTVFIVLFPQLTCAVFVPHVNAYGSFCGYAIGLILRLGGGDAALGINPFIKYPYYDNEMGQLFPYKTLAMLSSLVTIISISFLTKLLFVKHVIPSQLDVAGIMSDKATLYQEKEKKTSLTLSTASLPMDLDSSDVKLTKF